MSYILEGVGLGHSYDYPLFENLNLQVKAGESLAILGASGCGKSSLLHILSTLLKPKQGEVLFNAKSLYKLKDDELNLIRRLDFGIIFQSHYLFKGFSAAENIELASVLSGQSLDKNLLDRLGISEVLSQKVGSLSGGQQQRVSIARVLAKSPKIIFADEPTGNLDKNTANDVMDVMFEYVKENSSALILVTHDENIAKKCDISYRLENATLMQEF